MKLTKKDSCFQCTDPCDIQSALIESGRCMDETKQFQAHFKKHDVICKQGNDVSHAMILVKGSVKLYVEGLNSRNIILYILKPPTYIGLLSFFEIPVYAYSVAALEDTEVCFIELEIVKKLYLENNDLRLCLNKAFGHSVVNIMNKIVSLNQKQIRGRIAENLIYLSDFHQSHKFHMDLTRKEFGEMAAISEENTVRLLSEFAKENILRIKGREIEIVDMSLLKKFSDVG